MIATVCETGDLAYQLQEEMGSRGYLTDQNSTMIFFSGILSERDFMHLAILNGLPQEVTGMKFSEPFVQFPKLDHRNFEKFHNFSSRQYVEFYTYNVIIEQLKRADSILKNTTDIYSTITKAASISKTVGIGQPETGYLPVEEFSKEDLDE